nr:retrovirus-related Pol polyprotein from transposon TNT 1-94 [Tanacetum cinerariifolium]
MANSNNPYAFPAPHQDQPSFNQNYMQQPMPNPEDITDPTTAMNMALALMAKVFKLNYSTPTNNNQMISSNLRNRQIAQPGMNMGQDRQMQMVGGNANLNGNGNLVAARAEGNAAGHNGNLIRCYNCRGVGHFPRNCTVKLRRRDAAYLQTQLLIAQKEEAGIQLQAKEFDLMAAVANLNEIEEVNANCILIANLQQASTSSTQTDKAHVYDSDGSAEYTELLEPIPELHQVPQNDNNVIFEVTSMEQSGETVEQHPANFEETRALYDSLNQNLAIEVEKVNTVNRKLKETNAYLTTELARFKNQEKCFEISQEKYDKLERCYNKPSDLTKQLSKKKSTISFLLEEKKRLKSDFKIREDKLLDKQIQLEKKIKDLNNILVKTGQSIQTIHMLSPKPDSFYHSEQKMALGYQNPFYLKQAHKKQQSLYDGKVLLEKHDPPVVHDSEETLQLAQENEEFSDDTTPSVVRKFLNEVKSTIMTLQRVVKHRITLETHNWSSSAHQELHKIVKDENFPIVSQVDARVQNFEIQFLKEATKFVGDFKSLAKEADDSLDKHNALELEIERLLRVVVSQDIMFVVKKGSVVNTSNLQTELECMKERFENCIIKKENEYAKLWNDWMNPFKTSREAKHVPNNVRASARTKLITVSQPSVISKKDVNSDSNGLSSTGIDNTKTRRSQPKSNTKNDRVPSASKSSRSKNKEVEGEEHHMNLLFSKNSKHMLSACNSNMFMVRRLGLFQAYDWKSKASHQFRLKVYGNCSLQNDHVAAYLGLVIFKVAFRRNACFVRNLDEVDLLKGDRSTYFYTINLYEMASASPMCLMARASSTKSWLWHQRLSHLNFDTINDLARNDLVSGLPKFKYHKEHLCPSCEQGKRKRASHPPKPVPNSRQMLHLLHMDLCGPMRIASINEKRYVLVIVDDYSRYTWVHFLRSKDEAPEVIKTFLKRITVVIQSHVIIIRTDNDTEFKNQVPKEYFDCVGISHQMSSIRTPQQNGVVERRNRTMTIETHNWSSSAHQELHKIHKALELETKHLLKAVVSQDIMIMQKESIVDTSDLETELDRTKERFENCIIKKENEYAKLWNDWYKKCDECKYDKISYDKAYKDMKQKIERLQAQLGDLKGKSKDNSCVSDTQNPLS